MAKDVRLFLGEEEIDLAANQIALNFTIADIKNPFTRSGGFSKTMKAPGSPQKYISMS